MTVDFDKLFYLGHDYRAGSTTIRLDFSSEEQREIFSGRDPQRPITGEWFHGKARPKDACQVPGCSFLLSRRAIALLESSGFSGWKALPCTVRGKRNGWTVEGYQLLQVTGRCGQVDFSRSVEVLQKYPAGVFPVLRGLYFEESSWDGSDFFSPPGWTMVVVTERVRDAFVGARLRGIEFAPLTAFDRIPPGTPTEDRPIVLQ